MLNEDLKLGSTGNNVKILQEKLKILGFYNAVVNGSFGLATKIGVKAFQREYNLEETGIVNNAMWQLLFRLTEVATVSTRANPTLSIGSTGEAVRELQTKLKALLYYTGPINSTFDLETENALKRFQYNNDLTTTGTTNTQTWNVLNSLYGNLNSCVTGESSSGVSTYTVQPGDTLYGIARKFNLTVEELKRINNLTSNILTIGQVLKVAEDMNMPTRTYTVQPGDTLYGIARKFNITVEELKRINNLTSNILTIGQILQIPASSTDTGILTYTVVPGDTLYGIARKFNTTVDQIKQFNNLTSNILTIGQVLQIPTSSNMETRTYTVQPGDTLYGIAKSFNTTVDRIKQLNNLTSNTLSIGQVLRV